MLYRLNIDHYNMVHYYNIMYKVYIILVGTIGTNTFVVPSHTMHRRNL